jgi:hypothetical protein
MADEDREETSDKGIGEGQLAKEPGAPPYSDRAYAGGDDPNAGVGPSHAGTAGGANVSAQGGGADSSKQGGNTGGSTSTGT